jgi:Prolyl oligopeptidase family
MSLDVGSVRVAVTLTRSLAAGVAAADVAGWCYTADFTLFTARWFRGAPFEQAADFAARPAITHVARVKTPLMLIEGEADWRTPPRAEASRCSGRSSRPLPAWAEDQRLRDCLKGPVSPVGLRTGRSAACCRTKAEIT